MNVSVVLADDQAMVRKGLRLLLEEAGGIEVVGEAADGLAAVSTVDRLRPDVALLDIRMPGTDGIEATRRLMAAGVPTRVVMLTTFALDAYVYDALRAGASGFLVKDAPAEQLIDAVRVAARGDALLSPSVTRRVIEEFARLPARPADDPPELAGLTAREVEVLRLLATGASNAEIASRLVVSETTTKTHVGHVLAKLGLRDRIQAVVFAYESGLVRPGG